MRVQFLLSGRVSFELVVLSPLKLDSHVMTSIDYGLIVRHPVHFM